MHHNGAGQGRATRARLGNERVCELSHALADARCLDGNCQHQGDTSVGQHLNALRWSPRRSFGGDLILANDAAMLYVMTLKPGLAGSLLVVAGTILVVVVARAIRHGWRAPVMSQSPHAARDLPSRVER